MEDLRDYDNPQYEKAVIELKEEFKKENWSPDGWNIVKGDELLKTDIPAPEFLIEGLIPKGGITILSGNPSSCKSWILLEIARCIASNEELFGKYKTLEARTLYIDEETDFTEMKRRWKMLNPKILTLVDFKERNGFKIDNEEERKKLINACLAKDYRLVIFDSLIDVHSKNENDSQEARQVIECFEELTRRGITCLLSHHQRKLSFLDPKEPMQILRGSGVFSSGIDSLIAIEKKSETESKIELLIVPAKLRRGKKKEPFKIQLTEENEKMRLEYVSEVESEATKLERTKNAIISLLREKKELYGSEISKTLIGAGFSSRTIDRGLGELKDEGRFNRRLDKKRVYLSLKE